MALTDDNGMVMPVSPFYGGGGNSGNDGWSGDGGWWILLLFILLAGGRGFGGNGYGGGAGSDLYPWMNQAEITTQGFQNASLAGQLDGIESGIQNLSTQLCNCCSDMQMSNMQQAFASQAAMNQGFNQIGSQLADCCCENRLASADLKYTIATENCADRYEAAQNTRDIIESQTRGTQTIIDKLCQLELDAKNDKINDLERQLTMANLSASQIAQTAQIERGQTAEVDALYQRLRDCPVPTMPVYGSQPIFTCPNNNGCGCGCGCGNNF